MYRSCAGVDGSEAWLIPIPLDYVKAVLAVPLTTIGTRTPEGAIMNDTWSLVSVSVLACFALIARRIPDGRGRILVLFNLIWIGALALIGADAIRYKDAPGSSWLALLLALLAFNLAGLLSLRRSNASASVLAQQSPPEGSINFAAPSSLAIVTRAQLVALTLLYGGGVMAYLMAIDARFGIDLLLSDPTDIRSAAGESYLASVPLWGRILLYLGPILIGLYGFRPACTRPFPAVVRFATLTIVGISQLAMLQRTNLFMGALFLAALLLSSGGLAKTGIRPRRTAKTVLSLAILAGVLLGSFQLLADALGKTGNPRSEAVAAEWVVQTGMLSPIFYYTSGPVALLQVMDSGNQSWPAEPVPGQLNIGDNNPQTWGAAAFRPVLQVLPLTEPFPSIAPFIEVSDGVFTNVYTWFEDAYRDFREPGMVTFGALLGAIVTRLHDTRFQSLPRFWVQSWLLWLVFLSTFVSKLTTPSFIAGLIVLFLLARGAAHRQRSGQAVTTPSHAN